MRLPRQPHPRAFVKCGGLFGRSRFRVLRAGRLDRPAGRLQRFPASLRRHRLEAKFLGHPVCNLAARPQPAIGGGSPRRRRNLASRPGFRIVADAPLRRRKSQEPRRPSGGGCNTSACRIDPLTELPKGGLNVWYRIVLGRNICVGSERPFHFEYARAARKASVPPSARSAWSRMAIASATAA